MLAVIAFDVVVPVLLRIDLQGGRQCLCQSYSQSLSLKHCTEGGRKVNSKSTYVHTAGGNCPAASSPVKSSLLHCLNKPPPA